MPNEDRLSTPVLSQVAYEDQGVSIVSQPDKVHFTRRNGDLRASSEPDLAGVAISYVNALPHVEYTAMAVNVEGHVIVPEGLRPLAVRSSSATSPPAPGIALATGSTRRW